MATIAEIRRQYPQYKDLSDRQLADALRAKYYADIPAEDFYKRVGVGEERGTLDDIKGGLVSGFGQLVALPGQVGGLVTGDFDNYFTRKGAELQEEGRAMQSEETVRKQQAAAERVARAEETAEEPTLTGRALSSLIPGGGLALDAQFRQQMEEFAKDPSLIIPALAETAPSMLATAGAGKVGSIAVQRAARTAIQRAATAEAAALAARQAAARGAMAGTGVAAGSMVAGDTGETTYRRVMATPQETLERSNVYQDFIAEGMSPQEAREATALRQARLAAAPAGAVAALTAGLGGVESRLLNRGIRGGTVRGALTSGVREGAQEGIEEGSQAVSENLAVGEIDPTVQPFDDVGGRVATGIVLGTGAGTGVGGVAGAFNRQPATETPPDVAPPAPEPTEPGTDTGPAPSDVPDTTVRAPSPAPEDGGTNTVSLVVNGTPVDVAVTPEPDGNVIVEWPDGRTETVPAPVWDEYRTANAAPAVTEPAVTEPVTDLVNESPTDVTDAEIEPELLNPTIRVNGQEYQPTVTPLPDGNVSVDYGTGEPLVGPLSEWRDYVRANAAPAPITQEDFDAANTPTTEFETAVRDRTLPGVADYLAENATLPTVRNIMGRASGVLKAFEQAGIQTEFGVSGQRPSNFASTIMGRAGPNTLGRAAFGARGDGQGIIIAAIGGMRRANPGAQEVTAAHEIIHAVTMTSIRGKDNLPKNSRVRAAVDGLQGLQKEVRSFYRKNPDVEGVDAYRVSNPDELIAYGLTDYNFQQFLKTVPTKTGNAFTDFVRYIGRLLGIPRGEQNALARLIELSEDLIPVEASEVAAVAEGARRTTGMDSGVANDEAPPSEPPSVSGNPRREPIFIPDETRYGKFKRQTLDALNRLRQVESLGQLASADRSFYEAARRMNSKAAEMAEKFRRDYFTPIERIARENGLTLNDLDWYLYAKAAPERNARLERKQVARIVRDMETEAELKYGEGDADFDAQVDAAIAQAYTDGNINRSGSGISTDEAQGIVSAIETGEKAAAFQRISDLHQRGVRARMELAIRQGIISKAVGERLLREEPNYVPMKARAGGENSADTRLDIPDEDFETTMGYGGTGIAINAREWYDTQGRTSLPFSPYSTFVSDTNTSILRGERNAVSQLLHRFLEENPVEDWKIFSERNPPRDANGRPYRPGPMDEEFILTKRGGQTFWLRIGDPLTVRAARELSKEEMRPFLEAGPIKLARNLTRLLGRSFTTLQPSFFTVNYVRDIQAALLNITAEQEAGGRLDGKKVAARFAKEATNRKNFQALVDFEFQRENPQSAQADRDLIEQWKLDGGSVSWMDRKSPQEIAAELRTNLTDLNDAAQSRSAATFEKGKRGFKAMVDAIENANAVFEGMTRFAAYKAALESGASRPQAAMLSREITVDFQRRGEVAEFANNFYLFLSASIGGTARTLKSLRSPRVRAILGGAVATAATLAMYNAMVSGDDDDGELLWDKIPAYEKDRNLIIMDPRGGGVGVMIPMPYGFGFFTGLGTRVTDAMRRGDDFSKVANLTVSSALMNFSPIQFAGDNVPSNIAAATVPTILKPVPDLWRNENFMSQPIYNEPFDRSQSRASAARFSTPEVYKWWAQTLNDITGGEGKIPSKYVDTPPEAWKYLVEFAAGGVGNSAASLLSDAGKLSGAIEGREDLTAKDIPIARRFITVPSAGRNVGEFYKNADNAGIVQREMRDAEDKADFRRRYPVETDPAVVGALKVARSQIRNINKQRKALEASDLPPEEKAERRAELKARIDQAYIRFNTVYNRVEKEARR